MYYITLKASPRFHQMTLDELLFGGDINVKLTSWNTTNTRTYCVDSIDKYYDVFDVFDAYNKIKEFNDSTESIRNQPRESLYRSYKIPKHSGGLRPIDEPNEELMSALHRLADIFNSFGMLYHTSAFAYVKGRCCYDAVKRHQSNQSKWFLKTDFSNFFGSTTLEFTMRMLETVMPFAFIMKFMDGKQQLEKALELGFLRGGLPQGSPLSPMLTNIIMIPIDHTIANSLKDKFDNTFIYTRYADDIQISCRYNFEYKRVENYINEVLSIFSAPFKIKPEKTKYGSSAGKNWILGVMLNKDNEITIGHKKKKMFQTMLFNYAMDRKNGKPWSISDVQYLEGLRNYYTSIEPDVIPGIVLSIGAKTDTDIMASIKEDLKV